VIIHFHRQPVTRTGGDNIFSVPIQKLEVHLSPLAPKTGGENKFRTGSENKSVVVTFPPGPDLDPMLLEASLSLRMGPVGFGPPSYMAPHTPPSTVAADEGPSLGPEAISSPSHLATSPAWPVVAVGPPSDMVAMERVFSKKKGLKKF
jgi:hypothetical protein